MWKVASVLVLACALGCSRGSGAMTGGPAASTTLASAGSSTPGSNGASAGAPLAGDVAIDATATAGCELGHAGVLIDLGDASSRARTGSGPHLPSPTFETVEREGATWARFRDRTATFTFLTTGPADGDDPARAGEPTHVEARVRAGVARSVSVYLNGKAVGAWALPKNSDAAVVSVRAASPLVVPGENELALHFNGAPRAAAGEPLAEIDWIHVGSGDPDPAYAAPTRADAVSSVTLGGVSHRVVAVRAPGFVRCNGLFPASSQGRVSIALGGPGDADVDVRILRDRRAPESVYRAHLTSASAWQDVTFPTGDDAAFVGALDLEVTRASKGTRVLFGDARIVKRGAAAGVAAADAGTPSSAPVAKSVVLVVVGDLQPKSIPPYGGATSAPELTAFAQQSLVYDAHRASSSISSAALAAMLTGRLPFTFALDDADARLPASVTTIAEAARRAGVVTAFFTANPMTSAAFGFDRGWQTFASHPPSEPGPAVRIFDDAAHWIDEHKDDRFLLVLHSRGGHPPWDVAPEELKDLPPPEYSGGLDPQHAAELLSKARHVPPTIRFNDADRARAWALYARGVQMHDAAFGRLLAALKAAGRDADTAVIVTGDVSVNDAAHVPFGDGEPPTESGLAVPLFVRPPRGASEPTNGRHVDAPTSDIDLAPTILASLGLPALPWFDGTDLFASAAGTIPAEGRRRFASANGRYAARLGTFVLSGTQRRAELCDLALEAACLTDVHPTHPIAWDVLTRATFDVFHPPGGAGAPATGAEKREPATLDATAQSALKAWGR